MVTSLTQFKENKKNKRKRAASYQLIKRCAGSDKSLKTRGRLLKSKYTFYLNKMRIVIPKL